MLAERQDHNIMNENKIMGADETNAEDILHEESDAVIKTENETDAGFIDCLDDRSAGDLSHAEAEYEIVGVSFKKSGKIYYFDVDGQSYNKDDHVIVDTSRGIEFGTVVLPNKTVKGNEVVLPLRKVVRIATEQDEQHHRENMKKEVEAYNACVEKIAERNLEMKLVDVEYTFDNSKLLFYFTAEGRVDFRDLVKDLASIFRTRIELRQIGIRDEAKLMGGLGICGRPFCCHAFLPDFVQVSIKMAKEQNLSLNSSKISGSCGRLMCCLRYEYDVYSEEIKKTPKIDSVVHTEDGDGIVKETMPLAGNVKVEIHSGNDVTVKVFPRDEVTVIKGKTAKEFLAEKFAEKEAHEKNDKVLSGDKRKSVRNTVSGVPAEKAADREEKSDKQEKNQRREKSLRTLRTHIPEQRNENENTFDPDTEAAGGDNNTTVESRREKGQRSGKNRRGNRGGKNRRGRADGIEKNSEKLQGKEKDRGADEKNEQALKHETNRDSSK